MTKLISKAFGRAQDLEAFDTGLSVSASHQLVYIAAGTLTLEVGDFRWCLPPQCAAWITAGVEYTALVERSVSLRTIYFTTDHSGPDVRCSVFSISPLGREMILHAMRWPQGNTDPLAEHFFHTLSGLCCEWSRDALEFRLHQPRSEELRSAMSYALEHLAEEPRLENAARQAGVSPRTLSRRFADEAKTSWRQYLHTARMIRAVELLSVPGARVTDTAVSVGFDSLGAFSQAFRHFT